TTISIINNKIENGNIEDFPFNKIVKPEEHKLVALTLALSSKIRLDRSGKFFIHHYNDQNIFSPLNIEVEVSEGNSMDIVYYSESFEKSMNSAVLSATVDKDSSLNLFLVNQGSSSYNFVFSKTIIKGSVNVYIISTGFKESHVEYHSHLDEGAQAYFSSRALGVRDNKIDIKTNVYHEGKKSVSNGFMKAVGAENSFVVIRGDARIDENAVDSSTSIIGRAIMLGNDSEAAVSPMLEVRTGKVITAKHSAAISRVPDDYIFYLMNRGFDRKSAEGLIIRGFLEDEGDNDLVRNMIEDIITRLGY
ncbi:SufD family Fe-S cluster assembly protein, partial [Acidianus sp. RZ1]